MKTAEMYQQEYDELGHNPQVSSEEKELRGRQLLHAQMQTQRFENAVAHTIASCEYVLGDIKRLAVETGNRSATYIASRIQQRLTEALFNARIGNLTQAAVACKEAQHAVTSSNS